MSSAVRSVIKRGLSWACAHNDHLNCPGLSCTCRQCGH